MRKDLERHEIRWGKSISGIEDLTRDQGLVKNTVIVTSGNTVWVSPV